MGRGQGRGRGRGRGRGKADTPGKERTVKPGLQSEGILIHCNKLVVFDHRVVTMVTDQLKNMPSHHPVFVCVQDTKVNEAKGMGDFIIP